jgi:hypothetical protein
MSKQSEAVKRWRKNTKIRIVESFGNICCICKNTYPPELYDLHHIDPDEKEFSFGSIYASPISWDRIVIELRKCVMVCSNCHRLIHYYNEQIPEDANTFNEDFVSYNSHRHTKQCIVCKKYIPNHLTTCSRSCSAKLSRKVDWDNIDIIKLYEEYGNYTRIGEMLGVSAAAVRKRYLKVYEKQ